MKAKLVPKDTKVHVLHTHWAIITEYAKEYKMIINNETGSSKPCRA